MSGSSFNQIGGSCSDGERLEALARYKILDTPREPAFDDITRLASHICDAPVALISFVETERQWFKSAVGVDVCETPISMSICAHALRQRELFVVPDTLRDDRFKNNPLVTGEPHLRFYAGALLLSHDGHPIGTLCVLDTKPRNLTPAQADALQALARQVMSQLDLRRLTIAQAEAITHQRKTEEELIRARDIAESLVSSKDQFLAVLSHELRTPLTPVLSIAQSMENDVEVSESVRDAFATIRRNVELEARLIDDLLDMTRISRGKLELTKQVLDVHETLRQVMKIVGGEVDSAGPTLTLEPTALLHHVLGDATRLAQVFWNLLKNAIKFTPADGGIRIRTANTAEGELAVSVIDSGIGIDPALLPKLFDAFEQGGRDITRTFGGLGLGLSISKALVDLHEGKLTVRSDGKGRGSEFTVILATTAATVPSPARPAVRKPTNGDCRILLVEDHVDTARALARLLSAEGHGVRTAHTIADALDAAASEPFDVVVSDLGLPDGSGLDLMRQLLKRSPIKGIALTGYGMNEDIDKSRRAGFEEHLVKPINVAQLTTAIHRVTHGRC